MSTADLKRYYTEKEFCEIFEITRKTAFKWRKQRLIGFMRTPTGLIRYRESDLQDYERRTGIKVSRAKRAA